MAAALAGTEASACAAAAGQWAAVLTPLASRCLIALQILDGDKYLWQALGSGLWPIMVLVSEIVQVRCSVKVQFCAGRWPRSASNANRWKVPRIAKLGAVPPPADLYPGRLLLLVPQVVRRGLWRHPPASRHRLGSHRGRPPSLACFFAPGPIAPDSLPRGGRSAAVAHFCLPCFQSLLHCYNDQLCWLGNSRCMDSRRSVRWLRWCRAITLHCYIRRTLCSD